MAHSDTDAVVVLTTVSADFDVDGLATTLLAERLVACVNVLPPMQSHYRWQGRIESSSERQLLMKTTAPRIGALEERLRELHPYEVPEFLVMPADGGSAAYLAWLAAETAMR